MTSRAKMLGHLERIGSRSSTKQTRIFLRHFSDATPIPPKKKVTVAKTEYKIDTEQNGPTFPNVPSRPLMPEEISEKDEAFVASLNEFLRDNRVPLKHVKPELPTQENVLRLHAYKHRKLALEAAMREKQKRYGPNAITEEDIRRYIDHTRTAPVAHTEIDPEMSPEIFKKITTVVEKEVDMTEEEVEMWRRHHEIALYREKLREEAARAAANVPEGTPLGPTLPPPPATPSVDPEPPIVEPSAPKSQSSPSVNPYAAKPRAVLRPRRAQMPADVKARLQWLIEQAKARDLGDPEKRERLLYVSSLPPEEKLEAVKSLAILQEITSISMDWNRSSAAAIPTAAAPDAAAPTIEWRPATSLAPGSSDDKGRQLTSFFTTDTSLAGREYAFENVQVLPNLPQDSHLQPAAETPGDAGEPVPSAVDTDVELKAFVEAVDKPATADPTDTGAAAAATPVDQYDSFLDPLPVSTDSTTKQSKHGNDQELDAAAVERAKRLFAKDSVYVQAALQGKETEQHGVLLDAGAPSLAERTQANKLALQMLLRRKPRGKLHAGQLREMMVRHSQQPHVYHVDRLCEEYDISLLTVLEDMKQRVQDTIITDLGVGGFTPPVFKIKVDPTSRATDRVKNTPSFVKLVQHISVEKDPALVKRMTTLDEHGYLTLLASDVLIPNLPEHVLRPLITAAVINVDAKNSKSALAHDTSKSVYSHAADHSKGVGAVRPDETLMTDEDIEAQRESLVDNLLLLRGKSLQQLHALGMFAVQPYDGAVDDDQESNLRGRYAFSDNMFKAFSDKRMYDFRNDENLAKMLFGKNYTQRRTKNPAPTVTVDDAEDYGIADDKLAIDTQGLSDDVQYGPLHRAAPRRKPSTAKADEDASAEEAAKTKAEAEAAKKAKDDPTAERTLPIDEFSLLASVSAVLVKYQHHPRGGIDTSGINLVDETIRTLLRDGNLPEMNDAQIDELKKRAERFPILALEATLANTTVPYMYRAPERVPGVQTNLVGVMYPGQGRGKAVGYFHPDLFTAVHGMATGKGATLPPIDPDENGMAIDREAALFDLSNHSDAPLINVNAPKGQTQAAGTKEEYASVAMKYAQANAALGVGGAQEVPKDIDFGKHSMNTGQKMPQGGQTRIDTSSTHASMREEERKREEMSRTFADAGSGYGKVHVVTNLDEIEELDENSFNSFVMDVEVDESKTEHMLQFYYRAQERDMDLTRGVKMAGVLDKTATIAHKLKGRRDEDAEPSEKAHVVGTAEHVMGVKMDATDAAEAELLGNLAYGTNKPQNSKTGSGITEHSSLHEYARQQRRLKEIEDAAKGIIDADVQATTEAVKKVKDMFEGQKKELFGGPLAVKTYLEGLVRRKQKIDKDKMDKM